MKRALGLVIAAIFAIVGCSVGGDDSVGGGSPSTATQLPSKQVRVNTTHNPCQDNIDVKPGTCWLPLYTDMSYLPPSAPVNLGGSCTNDDERACWPQPDAHVRLVCSEDGPVVNDSRGASYGSRIWYGVLVPDSRLLAERDTVKRTSSGQAVAYASSVWLDPGKGKIDLPACADVLVG